MTELKCINPKCDGKGVLDAVDRVGVPVHGLEIITIECSSCETRQTFTGAAAKEVDKFLRTPKAPPVTVVQTKEQPKQS